MKRCKAILSVLLCAALLFGCGAKAPSPAETAPPETAAPEGGKTTVTVTTADEFLAAIAPDTEILVDTDLLDLTTASDYGTGRGGILLLERSLRRSGAFHLRGLRPYHPGRQR